MIFEPFCIILEIYIRQCESQLLEDRAGSKECGERVAICISNCIFKIHNPQIWEAGIRKRIEKNGTLQFENH